MDIHNIPKIFYFSFIVNVFSDAIKADNIVQSLSLEKSNLQNDFYIGPYLDGNEVTNITVQIGTNAYLPCKVRTTVNIILLLLLLSFCVYFVYRYI